MNAHPLEFLDVLCGVGPAFDLSPKDATVETLLANMDRLGVAEAAVTSLGAAIHRPMAANRELSERLREEPRLHPVWMVAMPQFGHFPPAEALAVEMRAAGVRMLRMCVGANTPFARIPLSPVEAHLDEMAGRRIPLVVEVRSIDLAVDGALETLLRNWPDLPVILSVPKAVGPIDSLLYSQWERGRNLRVELSGMQTLGFVEYVVQRFDGDRIVYGSRYPYFTQLQAMLQVIYADVPDQARRAIAGDTVRGLLDGAG